MNKLSAAQRAQIKRLAEPKATEEGGELNVVPFLDIIVNVMMFVLATVAVTFTTTADVAPPRPSVRDGKPLGLTIAIVDNGFAIKASGGNVGPGCRDMGEGLAVSSHDFASLHQCVASLKNSSAFAAAETSVTLTASPTIRYETLIATMDAVRTTDDGKDLFPDMNLALVR
jgi:biopolymer transport protein TolR